MKKKGMTSSAVQYLHCLEENNNIASFVQSGHQKIQCQYFFQSLNPQTSETKFIWIDGNAAYNVEVDKDYRILIEAQRVLTDKRKQAIDQLLDTKTKVPDMATFYQSELKQTVQQWVESYLVVTEFKQLIQFLCARFFIDGCHLSLFELQFTLSTFTHLFTTYRANLKFVQTLLASASQTDFVNILLFIRLCHRYEKQLDSKIWNGIQLIDNIRLKIVLGIKLADYDTAIEIDMLYKIILMLQHASTGSEKLENLTMTMWIDIAEKQTWSEISSVLKEFGTAGYYLGVLDSKGFQREQKMLSDVLRNVKYVPEMNLAMLTFMLCNREIEESRVEANLKAFERFCKKGNNWKCNAIVPSQKNATLITDEALQREFFSFLNRQPDSDGDDDVDDIFNSRKINDLKRLVVGQHDQTQEEKTKRQETVAKYCTYLEQLEKHKATTEACKILLEFDKHLKKLFKKTLRITQKMAVLCAVEAEEPVLEQVNTGEGKSFIIAAIAVIRCIRDKQTVDIITSSPVLAERDVKELEPLYAKFKLRVGHNCSESIVERQKAYAGEIVYGDISRFQRDYLMQTFYKKTILGGRIREVVIVDEVDNMLLDNGNNILYLSHDVPCLDILESLLVYILREVHSPIFNGHKNSMEHMKNLFETDTIVANVLEQVYGRFSLQDARSCVPNANNEELSKQIHNLLVKKNIIDADGYILSSSKAQIQALCTELKSISEPATQRVLAALTITADKKCEFALPTFLRPFVKLHLHEFVENCKKSMLMDEDYEYVVDIDRTDSATQIEPVVTIVDSNTGADLPTTQWNGGLHQFLQLKHGCRISPLSLKAVFVSNVAYLKGYKVINGLSGTLGSIHESRTLIDLYGADLIRIPTFKPKLFYEHAPILATNVAEWTKSIYDEINDQISAERSLLIICDSIAQAKQLHTNLLTSYKKETNKSELQKECFENIATYLRSCDEFDFEKGKQLEPGHVIIATNLAGRGTDIKLSEKLVKNRGLHVITAFMPKNARIEEQAFGRAARAGQPGSAQIIALIKEKDGVKPSIFQFKMYRDNIEVQRLAELKVFYDYHTEIEESCLEKFRSHCADVLSKVYSSKSNDNVNIQRPDEVVYFALLDKWAMWLDEKGPLINQCAKNNNEDERRREKEAIIASVDLFLTNHKLDIEEAKKSWLDFPQSLLTLGLYELCNKNFNTADKLFDLVIERDLQFSAEAYYYKACIRMPSYNNTEGDHINVNDAEKFFSFARVLLSHRLSACEKERSTVMQFVNDTNRGAIKSSGFEKQNAVMAKYISGVINNIDWIIGAPCTPDMFVCQNITSDDSASLYDKFVMNTVISPMVYVNYKPESWQLRDLHDVYGMSDAEIRSSIYELKRDMLTYYRDPDVAETSIDNENIPNDNDNNAFRLATVSVLPDRIHLSNRQSFFTELYENGVIRKVRHLRYADPNHVTEVENAMKAKNVAPVELPQKGHFMTLNNSVKEGRVYYNVADVDSLTNPDIQNKLLDEFIGEVFLESLTCFSYFTKFDGVTAVELAEYFGIDVAGAAWILQTLEDRGVLEHLMEQRTRFTTDNQLWENKVEIYLTDPDEKEASVVQKYAQQLQNLRSMKNLQHLSIWVLKKVCNIEDNDVLKDLYNVLMEEKLIEDFIFAIFRLNNRLDVSCLPASIANSVDFYLSNKFAYSFALERLSIDIDSAGSDPEFAVFHTIYLPEYPYKQYFNDLQTCGFVSASRIITKYYEDLDEDSFDQMDDILATILKYKSKLLDQTEYHLDFVSLEKYITNQGIPVHTELKYLSDRGLKVVMGVAEGNVAWTIFTNVAGGARAVVRSVVKGVKAFGSWLYNIGSKAANWINNNVIDPVVNAIGSAYKATKNAIVSGITAVTNYITSSKAYQVASACVKSAATSIGKIADGVATVVKTVASGVATVARTVGEGLYEFGEMTGINEGVRYIARGAAVIGNKIQESAAYISQKAKNLYNGAKEMAGNVLNYIAETRVIQWAKQAAKTAIDAAKYAYRKMTAFVKAAFESYDYYNQCRVYARRIALHEGLVVDEYTILRSYIDARDSAGQEDTSDDIFKHKLQKHLEATHEKALSRLRNDIETYIQRELNDYCVRTSECDSDIIKPFVEVAPGVLAFKIELEEKYIIESHKAKIVFVHLMTEFATNDAPFDSMEMPNLESNFSFDRLEGIVRKIVIDYASHVDMRKADNNQTSTESRRLTKVLSELLIDKISNSCQMIYATNPTSELLTFMTQLRSAGEVPELAEFDREDKMLKYGLSQYNAQVVQKKQNNAVLHEIVRSVQAFIDNREVLKTAIKYGFPLPIDSLKLIQPAINKVLLKPVKITVNKNSTYGRDGGKLLLMDHIGGCIFVTNDDYLRYMNVGEHAGDNFVNAFLFEGILKAGITKISGDHELFRQSLIQAL